MNLASVEDERVNTLILIIFKRCNDGFLAVYGARIENDGKFEIRPVATDDQSPTSLDDSWAFGPLAQPTNELHRPSQVWCGDKLGAILQGAKTELSPIISLRSSLILRFNASGPSAMNIRFRAFYKFTPGKPLKFINTVKSLLDLPPCLWHSEYCPHL